MKQALILARRAAVELGQPVILDPVGIGASPWSLEWTKTLLNGFAPSLLRVNPGEARALLHLESQAQGVDSPGLTDSALGGELARCLALERRAIVLVSGPEDFISDGNQLWKVSGGSPVLARVTGTGCMLSVLCGIFAAVAPDTFTAAVTAALRVMQATMMMLAKMNFFIPASRSAP